MSLSKLDFKNNIFYMLAFFMFYFYSYDVAAAITTIGDVASQVTQSFTQLAKLITAASYLAGLGFSIGAMMKFKQHKDNPTQIPVGTPVAMLFIAAALLFLPSILKVTSMTMFGPSGGQTATPLGTIFTGTANSTGG
jgi:intracellular multiplication protein IcmD